MFVLAPGQESLVRSMLSPVLPGGWAWVETQVGATAIVARYADRARDALAELRLDRAATGGAGTRTAHFWASFRASRKGPEERALLGALLASVRAREQELRWTSTAPDARSFAADDRTRGRDLLASVAALEAEGRVREALSEIDAQMARAGRAPELLLASATLRATWHDDARAAALALEALGGASPEDRFRAAVLLAQTGSEAPSRAELQRLASAPSTPPTLLPDLARLAETLGEFDLAEALHQRVLSADGLDPLDARREAHLALGRLRGFHGDVRAVGAHAQAVLERSPDEPRAHALVALAHTLSGEHAAALESLARTAAGDETAALLRVEALLGLDRVEEAHREVLRACNLTDDWSNHVTAVLLRALVLSRLGARSFVEPVLTEAMSALCPDAPSDFAAGLRALGGNRTERPTRLRADGALERIPIRVSPRTASKHVLWKLVATADPDEVDRDFERVHAVYPGVPESYNYHGELWLYLGDAARARACFERALALDPNSRWAHIGMGGVHVLEGEYEAALASLERGARVADVPGPTTFAYRGEAYRLLGRHAEGRADLEHAVRLNPERIGAWVNLGLLYAETGDRAGLARTLDELTRRAPGLVAEARAGGDEPRGMLERARAFLRGNRSSTCVTWFTRSGHLRVVPPRRLT